MITNNNFPIIEASVQITTLPAEANSERTYEGFSSLIHTVDWEKDSIYFHEGHWEIIQGAKASLEELESFAHEAFGSSISVKEKVDIFETLSNLFLKEGRSWNEEPSLVSTVSDAYASLNIAVPLSAISSWHFIKQLYSGGYLEEESKNLTIKLPEVFTIPAFERLLAPVDPKIEEMPLENLLALCELASYMGATTPFINTNVYEPSIENIALLSRSSASPDFLPYRAVVSSMISQYFLQEQLTTAEAIDHLKQIEGFIDWAREFPLDLDLSTKSNELTSSDLSLIGDIFQTTISLKINSDNITFLPEQFARIEVFISDWVNSLKDIHVLNNSKYLRVLEISGGKLLSLPIGCTSFRKVVLKYCTSITTLQPLDGSPLLEELELYGMRVLSFPKNCPLLKIVKILGMIGMINDTLDLSTLNNSSALTTLELDAHRVPITFPTDSKKLSKLRLSSMQNENISDFDDSHELRELILENMHNLEYLPINCPSLETIELICCNNVKDLSSLDGSQKLRRLVFGDQIPNIRLPRDCPLLIVEAREISYK